MTSTTNPPIQNIVLLMLENRSYDNVLGMLYANSTPPPGQKNLNGIANAQPNNNPSPPPSSYAVWGSPTDATTIPKTDPGETFEDMAQQFLGLSTTPKTGSPSQYPTIGSTQSTLSPGPDGLMGGFVANYAAQPNNTESPGDVMHCYVPELMPVTAYLARQFMVCDSWFSSVPTQTFANRLFSLCGQPGGDASGSFVDDYQYLGFAGSGYDLPNIFEMLDNAKLTSKGPYWKVYFHDYSITQKLINYVNGYMTDGNNANLANYNNEDYPDGTTNPLSHVPSTFIEDATAGNLPPFSLIEPRYSNNYPGMAAGLYPNSNHPGLSDYATIGVTSTTVPIDVMDGELLLLEVFTLLRLSPQWANTLLIVTYDEGGGLYDHVAPVPGVPPGSIVPKAANGFEFNWLGGRVPTLIISPFAPPGSQLVAPEGRTFDHTSILATVREYLMPGNTYFAGNNRIASAPRINAANGLNGSGNNPDPAAVPQVAKRR